MVGIIIGGIVAYAAIRDIITLQVRFTPERAVEKALNAKTKAVGFVDQARQHLQSKAQREEELAESRAQMVYDRTVGSIFENATPEEKQALLDLFAKYTPAEH